MDMAVSLSTEPNSSAMHMQPATEIIHSSASYLPRRTHSRELVVLEIGGEIGQ
jgi:hypothetical protein